MKDKKGVALSGRETARSCPIWFNLNIKEFVYLKQLMKSNCLLMSKKIRMWKHNYKNLIAKYKIIYKI